VPVNQSPGGYSFNSNSKPPTGADVWAGTKAELRRRRQLFYRGFRQPTRDQPTARVFREPPEEGDPACQPEPPTPVYGVNTPGTRAPDNLQGSSPQPALGAGPSIGIEPPPDNGESAPRETPAVDPTLGLGTDSKGNPLTPLPPEPDPDVDPTVLGSWPLGVTRPSKFSPTHKTFWRPCESCGTVFEAGNSLSRFCSQRCSKREYRKVQRRARSSQ